jgi:hypothetical protein
LLQRLLLSLLSEAKQAFRRCNPLCSSAEGRLVCGSLSLEDCSGDLGPQAEETLPKLSKSCSP